MGETTIPDAVRDWLLALDSPGLAVREWYRARGYMAVDWLRANAETIIHERLLIGEAYWRWTRDAPDVATWAAFERAKRIVFPNGWRRGRPILTADEMDVPGQELLPIVEDEP